MENFRVRKAASHRRSWKVCARCRKRKTKCDFKLPKCTPCKAANAHCVGFDPVTKTEIPRSLVRHLEDRVAELEAQVEAYQKSPTNLPSIFASNIAKSIVSIAVPNSRSFFYSTISTPLFLHSSCPPLPVARARRNHTSHKPNYNAEDSPQTKSDGTPSRRMPSTNLKSVPPKAIESMIRNYTDIHLPQYPCVGEKWLLETVDRVLEEQSGDTDSILTYGIPPDSRLTHFEYFVVFIVLAISSLTLTWRSEFRATAASESFCFSALKHLQLMNEVDSIQSLQVSLLLAHYAHMNPEKADNWTCISNAARIVLDLGLHKGSDGVLSEEQKRVRRRLFWVTYGMERSLCGILRLPLSFPEESITIEFDLIPTDDLNLDEATSDMLRRKSSANHIYLYRSLETEVHRVLHLREDEPLQGQDIYHWFQSINHRLAGWYEKAKTFSPYRMLEFRDVQFNHLLAKIHRPTPRLRIRTHEDRQICLEACQKLVESYNDQTRHARLFYPWHGVHILFEAAVIMLDACWESRSWMPLIESIQRTISVCLPDCLAILIKVGERWKDAALCAKYLRPIVTDVSISLDHGMEQIAEINTNYALTEKLRELLFPDGPLTWESPSNGSRRGSGEPTTPIKGVEEFQWDIDWDIADILISNPTYEQPITAPEGHKGGDYMAFT
ncbi:MAG: hypothetical protein M1834_007269 [Cirrosporium novae-zelandiae]|nr:MAG: hypothetical protein M1834_007269 [Cirrosporium novae-zelandiae]